MKNFIKPGVFFEGYDEKKAMKDVDPLLKDVLPSFNRVPIFVSYNSYEGHELKDNLSEIGKGVEGKIEFECYDDEMAERVFDEIMLENVNIMDRAFITPTKTYSNSFLFNVPGDESSFEEDQLFFYELKIEGFGKQLATAKKNQLLAIEVLKPVLLDAKERMMGSEEYMESLQNYVSMNICDKFKFNYK